MRATDTTRTAPVRTARRVVRSCRRRLLRHQALHLGLHRASWRLDVAVVFDLCRFEAQVGDDVRDRESQKDLVVLDAAPAELTQGELRIVDAAGLLGRGGLFHLRGENTR